MELMREIFNESISISNPLHLKTKAEAIHTLKKENCSELFQNTVSCVHTRQPKITPHCGTCSQCVDRRFAGIHA